MSGARDTGVALMVAGALAACATPRSDLPAGDAAYRVIPANTTAAPTDYRIGAQDELSISVFREPELSLDKLKVDAGGNLLFPLIGEVHAAGKTGAELAAEVARRLDDKYVRAPQVTVAVTASVSQRVTVEGSVNMPGIFEITPGITLLGALARAQSPTTTAKLDQVTVFRITDGQRTGAVFDIRRIRAGLDPDPRILGGDTVVVGFNQLRGALRDFLGVAPLVAAFRPF